MKKARSGLTGPQTRVNCARCGREVWGDEVDANQTAICKYCAMVVGRRPSIRELAEKHGHELSSDSGHVLDALTGKRVSADD